MFSMVQVIADNLNMPTWVVWLIFAGVIYVFYLSYSNKHSNSKPNRDKLATSD